LKLNYANEKSPDNFRSIVYSGGWVFFPIRDKIFRWNGSSIADVTPRALSITFPYKTYGRFDNFVSVGDWFYCTARTNETTYTESILCWDGSAWHKLTDPITDGDGSITFMAFDTNNNYLWFHVNKPTAATNTTYYIPFQAQSCYPYADFPTSGTHRLLSSRLEMGFRRIDKSMPVVLIEAQNCTSTRYLTISYALDGGSMTTWANITEDGTTVLDLPGDARTQEFEYIQFAVDFVTGTATQSPILESLVPMVLMRPDVAYGYGFDVVAASYVEDEMHTDHRTADEIEQGIKDARASGAPIRLETLTGKIMYGHLTSVEGRIVEYNAASGDIPDYETRISVNFVEALSSEL
jgi:hypothetical protein